MLSPERSKQVLGLEHGDVDDDDDDEEDEHDVYADDADELDEYGGDELRFSSGD